MDMLGHGKTGQFKVWSGEMNSSYSSSGQVKLKTRSDQIKSCQFGTRLGQVCCVQVKLGHISTGPGQVRSSQVKDRSRTSQVRQRSVKGR